MDYKPQNLALKPIDELLPGTVVRWGARHRFFDLAVVIDDLDGKRTCLPLDHDYQFRYLHPSDPLLVVCDPDDLRVNLLECASPTDDPRRPGTLTLVGGRAFLTAQHERQYMGHIYVGLSNWALAADGIPNSSYLSLSDWKLLRETAHGLETLYRRREALSDK